MRLAVAQNTAPIAVDDSARAEEGTGININVLNNDTDPDGDININSLSILTPPPNGEVFLHADGSIGYHPNDGFLGFDSFTYQICDFGNQCASATVTIEVFHTNHPPVALDIHTTSTDTGIDFGLTDNVSDPDGNVVSVKWWPLRVGSYAKQVTITNPTSTQAEVLVPNDVAPGQTIHLILEATDNGTPALTSYQRVVITVRNK